MNPVKVRSRQTRRLHVLTVTRGVLLPCDHGLWVEELTILACANLVDHVWLEIDVKRTRDVFPRRGLGEESTKAVGAISSHGVVASKAAVRLSSEA